MCLSTVDSLTTCFVRIVASLKECQDFQNLSHESARNKRPGLAQQCRMLRFMIWLRLLGSELYTLSTYFRPVSFRTSEVPGSDEWWYLGLAGCSGGSGKDLAVDFNLNGRKCDLLLLMQGVSSGLLVLFSDVCSCLSTYIDV